MKKILVALFSALFVFALASCMSEDVPENENDDSLQNGTVEKDDEKKDDEKKDDEKKEEKTFSLNETAKLDQLRITALEIKESDGKSLVGAKEGNVYVGIKFSVENTSSKEQTVSSILLFDGYADDVKSDLSVGSAMAFDGGSLDGSIAPGKKMVGWYSMEVPKDWKTIELHVKSDWLSSESAKFRFTK